LSAIESERRLLAALKPKLHRFDDHALNAEASPELLDAAITPVESFFVRNNGWLPDEYKGDRGAWSFSIDGEVERPAAWTLAKLREKFATVNVTAVLECAGYGREGYDPPTDGVPWGRGPVGCARWTGVRLAEVLRACGVKPSAVYTGHHSGDMQTDGSGRAAISRGIPIEKAMAPETLLAFEMNGEPLSFLHGGPLRIVVPGFPGSAWQKWLSRLELRDREHDGEKMRGTDYRLPVVPVRPGAPLDETKFAVITDMPVNSLITAPMQNFTHATNGALQIRGFAWSGHVPLASVAVSADGGNEWQAAHLEDEVERFAWRRFRATFEIAGTGPVELMARTTDIAGRAQPLDSAPWNPRGYGNNAVHRVRGTVARNP
jgi:DMSO/TMAO reductase YedYZ molybdopterin-dependent catalytic subunit